MERPATLHSWLSIAAAACSVAALLAAWRYSTWRAGGSVDEASRAPDRVVSSLARLGKSYGDFNDYERVLLSEVVFPEEVGASFDDIGGLESVKLALREAVINPMKDPAKYSSRLLSAPRGVLLYGPPGNGKTMLAKALAAECHGVFINVQPSSIHYKYVGESPRFAKAFFSLARKLAPAIIFIDEVDCLFQKNVLSENPSDAQVRGVMLSEWDGLNTAAQSVAPIIVIAATNNPAKLEVAVHRRLARQFEIGLPDQSQRICILQKFLKGEQCADAVLVEVAERTAKYCASDLLELCKAAATIRLRDCTDVVRPFNLSDFEEAMAVVNYAGASADQQLADVLFGVRE